FGEPDAGNRTRRYSVWHCPPRIRSVSSRGTVQRHERRAEVGKIVVSENVTIDGVIQDPAGDEGFRLGGWVGLIKDRPAVGKAALDDALGAEAFLFGRRTYEFFAARWPSRNGEL